MAGAFPNHAEVCVWIAIIVDIAEVHLRPKAGGLSHKELPDI